MVTAEQNEVPGEDRRRASGSEQFVVVKSWHVLITVLTLFVGIVTFASSMKYQTDQNSEDIRELKAKPEVTRDVYEQGQKDLERRLERIETKVDNLDLREYRLESGPGTTIPAKKKSP